MSAPVFFSSAWLQPKTSQAVADLCLRYGEKRKVRKQTQLFNSGFRAEEIHYLQEGLCRYVYYDKEGRNTTLSLILPGRSIGDLSIVTQTAVPVNFEVMRDSVFWVIKKTLLTDFLEEHPEAKDEMIRNVVDRFNAYLEGFYSVVTLDSEERFAKLIEALASEANECSEEGYFRLPLQLSQETIAEILSTSRVTVNRLLQQWKKEGRLRKTESSYWVDGRSLPRTPPSFSAPLPTAPLFTRK